MTAVLDRPHKVRRQQLKRITPQQQQYAEYLAQGMPQGQAALKAGYSSKTGAYKAHKNPVVQQYLSDIQRNAQARAGYTVVVAMGEAKDAMDFAYKTDNASAYVKAVELRSKLSGLLIDRVEVFTMDLKGALDKAASRVVNINPAYKQLIESEPQASPDPVG